MTSITSEVSLLIKYDCHPYWGSVIFIVIVMLLYAEVMLTELIVDFKIGTTSSIPDIIYFICVDGVDESAFINEL